MRDVNEIRDRIREIDDTLKELGGELDGSRDQSGHSDPQDFGDAGQDLQARAERDSQVQTLKEERGRLSRALENF
ncbi:hypothetical protein BTM25_15540 [Actinomadura rubteroloni]|uniref:Uncharacterized protein n=1 Tax=Actinomadura rubteroloni TaxID=1926885 RepID=A0A2P4UQ43_9ACTN|nr:hypothetical protein [Actinomadura rubteroloni]POM27144.1 hypothetical protein BTM25_15540 [Actinomadura rubteroloni]